MADLKEPTPEQDRLARRFRTVVCDDGTVLKRTIRGLTWGPKCSSVTPEERAAIVNSALDQEEARAADTVPVPVAELRAIYKALHTLTGTVGAATVQTVQEWLAMPEKERELRQGVRRLTEFPALFASQRLPSKDRDEVREEIRNGK